MTQFVQDIIFKNGLLYDESAGGFVPGDLLIKNGKIKAIGQNLSASVAAVDVRGAWLLPGLIDMHVHLREPGQEYKETLETGAAAAMAGGFTTVCCMPNTIPVIDTSGIVEFIKKRSQNFLVTIHPVGAVTKGRKGEELVEMADLQRAGAVAFSDDGDSVKTAEMMRRALEYSKMLGALIIDHCEDVSLSEGKHMNEGLVSTRLGIYGIPHVAEEIIVARDILLAAFTGGRLHLAHVSTKASVEMIREAKRRGIPVTAETCPHHFSLTDEAVVLFDSNLKVNPPLRTAEDVAAVKEGLRDGTIDVIASDHAPHAPQEKEVEFDAAPFGLTGMETAVGLVFRELVQPGILTPRQVVEKMAINPAKILNLGDRSFKAGNKAHVTVLNPAQKWVVDVFQFKSKARNCPFQGWELVGKSLGVYGNSQWWSEEIAVS
ncbi:dihydroorotase [bacterium BMS3Bbin03]|nr:dihydroorotase [bacterium BMS3Bbin03]